MGKGGYVKDGAAVRLTALRRVDHGAWFREVTAALCKAATIEAGCRALGVGRSTLHRWCAEDAALQAVVDGITGRRRAETTTTGR